MMSGKWVTEAANGYGQTIEVTRQLCDRRTKFQTLEV